MNDKGQLVYDLIIIGGSAAATSAGIYAARRGLNFKIITKEFGGEVATSGEIGNWPGINQTDGIALAQQFREHLAHNGVEPQEGVEVTHVKKMENGYFCITAQQDGVFMAGEKLGTPHENQATCDYTAKAVIVTTGVHPRELNVPGEKAFRTKGVSYCTTCDGPLFRGKVTATIGGGNSALESALMLADISSKVYVINKNAQFKGESVLIEKLKAKPNVEILYSAQTAEITGEQFVKALKYKDASGEHEIAVDGIFVHIGQVPNSHVAPTDVARDEFNQIIVNDHCETNIPGLYAAGDVTNVPFKQIVIAAGQGCIATLASVQYLNRLK